MLVTLRKRVLCWLTPFVSGCVVSRGFPLPCRLDLAAGEGICELGLGILGRHGEYELMN